MYGKFLDQQERGQNLKHLIKESRHRTQAKFAMALGINERTVGRWINEGFDNLYIAQDCAKILGVGVEAILFRD